MSTTSESRNRRQAAIDRMEIVPNAPFRKYYLEVVQHRDTPTAIAGRAGFYHGAKAKDGTLIGDSTYFLRLLGLKACSSGRGYPPYYREFISYEIGVKLADAMGLDYTIAGV